MPVSADCINLWPPLYGFGGDVMCRPGAECTAADYYRLAVWCRLGDLLFASGISWIRAAVRPIFYVSTSASMEYILLKFP